MNQDFRIKKYIFDLLYSIFQALMLHTYIADTVWKFHQDWIKIEVTISKNVICEFWSGSAPLRPAHPEKEEKKYVLIVYVDCGPRRQLEQMGHIP